MFNDRRVREWFTRHDDGIVQRVRASGRARLLRFGLRVGHGSLWRSKSIAGPFSERRASVFVIPPTVRVLWKGANQSCVISTRRSFPFRLRSRLVASVATNTWSSQMLQSPRVCVSLLERSPPPPPLLRLSACLSGCVAPADCSGISHPVAEVVQAREGGRSVFAVEDGTVNMSRAVAL